MRHFVSWLFGKQPADAKVRCPNCGHLGTMRDFGTWEKDGEKGLRGKLPTGHIVVACPACRKELKYDSIWNKLTILTEADLLR